MRFNHRILLLLLGGLTVAPTSAALACQCPPGPPGDEWDRTDAVFTATVVALTLIDTPVPAVRVELKVQESLKGPMSGRVVVYMRAPVVPPTKFTQSVEPVSGGIGVTISGSVTSSCEFTDLFALGRDYVVAAFPNQPQSSYSVDLAEAGWVTHFCTATRQANSDDGRRFLAGFREIAKSRR